MKKTSNKWVVELVVEMVKRGAEYAAEHADEIAESLGGKGKKHASRPKRKALKEGEVR